MEKKQCEAQETEVKVATLKKENESLNDHVRENKKMKVVMDHNEGEIFNLKKELSDVYKENETHAMMKRKLDIESEAERAKHSVEIKNMEKELRE